jgi:hypothetical protein
MLFSFHRLFQRTALTMGPPLPADYHYLGGMHFGDEDPTTIIWTCIRDPQQLQPTMARFAAITEAERQKRRRH